MKESYSFFSANGNGTFEMSDGDLKMTGWKNLTIKKGYCTGFSKINDLSLNKVECEMKYFDMFGGTETINFAMREADYRALKKALGK